MRMQHRIPQRSSLLVPAVVAGFIATVSLAGASGAAADDCLAGPNAPSPAGTHWYYRVDRTTHQKCWYLGAEGGRVRVQTRQASAAAQSLPSPALAFAPSPAPATTTLRALPPRPSRAKSAEAAPKVSAEVAPKASAAASNPVEAPAAASASKPADDAVTSPMPMRQADAANTVPAEAGKNASSPAQEQPATDPATNSEDEMPLIWPVLTPEERADVAQPTASAFAHLAGVFAAVMAIAALLGMLLLRISSRRSPRRSSAAKTANLRPSSVPRVHSYDADAHEESALPADGDAGWPGWPSRAQYACEDSLPELLRQMQWQRHEHALDVPLAAAR